MSNLIEEDSSYENNTRVLKNLFDKSFMKKGWSFLLNGILNLITTFGNIN